MAKPGEIVTVDFPGATGIKRRPVVIVSTTEYHAHRPDVIVGLITSQISAAITPFDYALQDWEAAGLHRPSAFRTFLATLPAAAIGERIGRCTERDWQAIQLRISHALAVSTKN
jgi:mRNA interferase MazF